MNTRNVYIAYINEIILNRSSIIVVTYYSHFNKGVNSNHTHSLTVRLLNLMGTGNDLVTDILQNIFFCVQQKK